MKKEQIFLVTSAAIAALLVYGSVNRYHSVGAAPDAMKVDTESVVLSNPLSGIGKWTPGKNLFREYRTEVPLPRPKLEAPRGSDVPWIRPVPWPAVHHANWSALREPMAALARPGAAPAPADDTGAAPEEEDPEAQAKRVAADDAARVQKEKDDRRSRAAVLVYKNGNTQIARITPVGTLEGKEPWSIIESWPNVQFKVEELNDDGLTVRAVYTIGAADIERYQTVHLEKTLDNEFNEERVRRGVRANDRDGLIAFAQWILANLKPRWGVPAVRLALGQLRQAWTQGPDLALARLVGDVSRQAYDSDTEVKTFLDYLQGPRANDAAVLVLLGDAYERAGAAHAAADAYRKASETGDAEGAVRLGLVLLRLADRPTDFDAAYAEFEKGASRGSPAQKARASAGQAASRLAQGKLDEALRLANAAKSGASDDWFVRMTLGSVLYAKGQFAPAETEFRDAIALEPGGGTRARSNRGLALLALDRAPDAVAELEACIAKDPLNYLDPVIGLGEANQRWGDLTKADDYFATARMRSPAHVWTLLRLAGNRLRDGREEQALTILKGGEGMPGLLTLAPESVDALRIAGLASATLDVPDFETAIRFLTRAREKEPKNIDVVYDLARTLAAAGKFDQSLALLDHETDPNTGAAKNDMRVLGLLAYVKFTSAQPTGEVYDALNRSRRAIGPTWAREYVEDLLDKVQIWDRSRIFKDDFNRAPSGTVGGGWAEQEPNNVVISADGNVALFKTAPGQGAVAVDEREKATSLKRPEELQRFLAAESSVRAGPGFEFVFHFWTGNLTNKDAGGGTEKGGGRRGGQQQGAEVGLGRDRNGRMCWFIYPAGGTAGATQRLLLEAVKDAQGQERQWPEDNAFHEIRIERTDDKKGVFRILFDGEALPEPEKEAFTISALTGQRGKQGFVGWHVDADQGVQVEFAVDWCTVERLVAR